MASKFEGSQLEEHRIFDGEWPFGGVEEEEEIEEEEIEEEEELGTEEDDDDDDDPISEDDSIDAALEEVSESEDDNGQAGGENIGVAHEQIKLVNKVEKAEDERRLRAEHEYRMNEEPEYRRRFEGVQYSHVEALQFRLWVRSSERRDNEDGMRKWAGCLGSVERCRAC